MRYLIILFGFGSLFGIAAAYSKVEVVHPHTYANAVSHSFASGDNEDTSGWVPCLEVEHTRQNVGIVCEGQRSIQNDGGQMMHVNYYCEFQFDSLGGGAFRATHALCL